MIVFILGAESIQQPIYHLNTVNLNHQSSWFTDQYSVGIPLSVVNVTQLEKDTLLVCLESKFRNQILILSMVC